jgi:hypothetical protein
MSKRLQVLLPDQEMTEIQRLARRERLTVGEWVRRVLREAREQKPSNDPEAKLKAIRRAVEFSFPTADLEQMNRSIGLSSLIFIDSNIPMYLIGAPHPQKSEAQLLLERPIASGQRLVTGAEALKEILHRYTAIGKQRRLGRHFNCWWTSWTMSSRSRRQML